MSKSTDKTTDQSNTQVSRTSRLKRNQTFIRNDKSGWVVRDTESRARVYEAKDKKPDVSVTLGKYGNEPQDKSILDKLADFLTR